ncbi:MAG: UDP-glucose--hexose-1-phosphate uridylyltransferase [Bacteroidetes bacterium]|nr:UDP-glucose--hexose-1-phosphate uridylyltransferase [Bacteroidota bacterium]
MEAIDITRVPHRRKNILTGEWVLVSPQRTNRPWQGEISKPMEEERRRYEPDCYLCPGNKRANGDVNPDYKNTFAFTNDYSALFENTFPAEVNKGGIIMLKAEKGICRVINYSPRHDLTLAEMTADDIERVIDTWQDEFRVLSGNRGINYIQIFENKGAMMGNSNPHPHCQIWAQGSIPNEPSKEQRQFKFYYNKTGKSLLAEYLKLEKRLKTRIVYENSTFSVIVPFWAVWPFETIIISKRRIQTILDLKEKEKKDYADAISIITKKYDNLFRTSFPYSAGLHQAPTDGKNHPEWHFHMHFYPPLLRSASIKKFMVGYEMLAEPQRDITPEYSADVLKKLPVIHYKKK